MSAGVNGFGKGLAVDAYPVRCWSHQALMDGANWIGRHDDSSIRVYSLNLEDTESSRNDLWTVNDLFNLIFCDLCRSHGLSGRVKPHCYVSLFGVLR
jgi:hypothetical protein